MRVRARTLEQVENMTGEAGALHSGARFQHSSGQRERYALEHVIDRRTKGMVREGIRRKHKNREEINIDHLFNGV